jgi:single-strand DNA-binding protein
MLNVSISARLVKDPEIKVFKDDLVVCTFTVVSNRYDPKADDKKGSDFFDCKLWGKRGATFAEHFKKGDGFVGTGQLEQEKWEDKETGKGRSKAVIKVYDWEFPIAKKEQVQSAEKQNVPF